MRLFCFGIGYSALSTIDLLRGLGWEISGTTRNPIKQEKLASKNIKAVLFDTDRKMNEQGLALLRNASHVLVSIPPQGREGDMVFANYAEHIRKLKDLEWFGYLSSTGVYGDHNGDIVTEKDKPEPANERGKARLKAEEQWLSLQKESKLPVHIFRLASIYGPGRNVLERIRHEKAPVIKKEGHFFNRIHVADIANVLHASMTRPNPGSVYNVSDDEPTPSSAVSLFGYQLLGKKAPEPTPFEKANLSQMGKEFYMSNKRLSNEKIKEELGVLLSMPTYREGLRDCLNKIQP